MKKLSVIIPVYNVEEYLEECLNSVCNQTLTDIEIICVNDGSTDNSGDILQDFAKQDTRIQIINQEFELMTNNSISRKCRAVGGTKYRAEIRNR